MSQQIHDQHNRPVVFGVALVIGLISLVGGILIFLSVVPLDMSSGGVPRDVNLIFTQVFSQQGLLWNERRTYAASLTEVGVDDDTCRRYGCLLRVPPEAKDYEFRLSKNGRTWAMHSKSPVPAEVQL